MSYKHDQGIPKIYSGSPRDKIKPTRTRESHNGYHQYVGYGPNSKGNSFNIFRFVREIFTSAIFSIELFSLMGNHRRVFTNNQGAEFKSQAARRENVRVHQRKGNR